MSHASFRPGRRQWLKLSSIAVATVAAARSGGALAQAAKSCAREARRGERTASAAVWLQARRREGRQSKIPEVPGRPTVLELHLVQGQGS